MGDVVVGDVRESLEDRLNAAAPRLRSALIANLGRQVGDDAYAEALFYAWTHADKVATIEELVPYLFRVGRSRVRDRRLAPPASPMGTDVLPDYEPRLGAVLDGLSPRQRTAVVLVVGWGGPMRRWPSCSGSRRVRSRSTPNADSLGCEPNLEV